MITHLYKSGKKFYAGCLSCRNPPHLSGLGTGIKRHRNVPPMAGPPMEEEEEEGKALADKLDSVYSYDYRRHLSDLISFSMFFRPTFDRKIINIIN